jgi:formyltetrahydrofolate synthetase
VSSACAVMAAIATTRNVSDLKDKFFNTIIA